MYIYVYITYIHIYIYIYLSHKPFESRENTPYFYSDRSFKSIRHDTVHRHDFFHFLFSPLIGIVIGDREGIDRKRGAKGRRKKRGVRGKKREKGDI